MAGSRKRAPEQTIVKRIEQHRDRWSAFGAPAGLLGLSERMAPEELRHFEIFRDYDDEFLESISADVTLAKWKRGAILFEEGAYLDLAFFIVQGAVEVYLQKLSRNGRARAPQENARGAKPAKGRSRQSRVEGTEITFLSTIDFNLPAGSGKQLGPGDIIGEIGAMNGWPQSVTARTASDSILVQIRVPALRKMKRKSSGLKARLDKIYRERSLFSQLKTAQLFQRCDDAVLETLARRVELISCEPGEVIAREGEAVEALYLVRSGFVKLAQKMGEGEIVVSYLRKGKTLGEVEMLIQGTPGWMCTATSVEYSDLIQISREDLQALVKRYPDLGKDLWGSSVARIKQMGASKKNINQSEFLQFSLEKGLVEGSSILVIDLDACTRCDDCVRGCADTHGGLPRFVREGDKYENLLIPKSCYHCQDPVCLVGCPTGAIRRATVGEVVEIVDDLCIGCKACANNCPYDAIIMHDTGEVWPPNMVPEMLRGKDRLLASKCDLCYKTNHEPACVSNCPHGCAIRVSSGAEFQTMLNKKR
jgi:CRP-like cAMP-binding protein/Fe-S-cluster-containing dehydrogenase component